MGRCLKAASAGRVRTAEAPTIDQRWRVISSFDNRLPERHSSPDSTAVLTTSAVRTPFLTTMPWARLESHHLPAQLYGWLGIPQRPLRSPSRFSLSRQHSHLRLAAPPASIDTIYERG